MTGLLPGGASRRPASHFRVCENVRDVFLLLEDISGRNGSCQRQMNRRRASNGLEERQEDFRLQEDLAMSLAPNSADSRFAAVCTSLARLCSTWSVMRQIGPDMPSAPITSPVLDTFDTARGHATTK